MACGEVVRLHLTAAAIVIVRIAGRNVQVLHIEGTGFARGGLWGHITGTGRRIAGVVLDLAVLTSADGRR